MIDNRFWALLPDALLQDSQTLQERTALVVDHTGQIQAITAADLLPAEIPVERFPGELWTAAPIMAHAHLESFDAPSSEWRGVGFSGWVEQLLAWRMASARLDAASSAALSLAELARFGCGLVATHVAEAGADGHQQASSLPKVLAMAEVFAPSVSDFDSTMLDQLQQGQALALHAPFSIADDIARAVFKAANGGLLSIHLGEHDEERQLLAEGSGPLAELLRRRGRALKEQQWASPVDWLEQMGGMQRGTLVVHGGDLGATELHRLAAAEVGVVFCPGTHQYFERPAPAFLHAATPLPALGCDSRASNTQLDPLHELTLAFAMMPDAGPQAWWQALTARGAEVLLQPSWGSLAAGKTATILRLELGDSTAPPLNARSICQSLCEGWRPQLQVSAWPKAGTSVPNP